MNTSTVFWPKLEICVFPGTSGSFLNPSCSGNRNQEDRGLKPSQANSSERPLEKPFIKKGLVEWLKLKPLNSSSSMATKTKIFYL
jgi:hypothetical protein